MVTNYLKTALRNFYRHLTYTSINVFGLTIGLATSILIYLWIADEYTYDNQYHEADRIYAAITNHFYTNGTIETGAETSGLLAESLVQEYPEIQFAARTSWDEDRLLRFEDKSIMQKGILADPSIFSIFQYTVLEGPRSNPLPDKNSIVLTRSTAEKFFPAGGGIGKVFSVEEKYDMRVTAIIEDVNHTQLPFDFIVHYQIATEETPWLLEWDNSNDRTFVKLNAGVSAALLNQKLQRHIRSKCGQCDSEVWLQRFSETRLYDSYANGKASGGRIEYIRIFTVAGVLVLIIACINFMNLSTARSATRSREVGVRKVVGAQRKSLIAQFIGESLLTSFVALALALALVQLLIPAFNSVVEKNVSLDFTDPGFTVSVVGITFLTGLVAGSYPALFLSSLNAVTVLKGNTRSIMTGGALRKTLVVVQFVLSIVLIITSVVIFRQVNYIKNKNLGFDRDQVITFRMRGNASKNKDAMKSQVLAHPSIKSMTFAGQDPFSISWTTTAVTWPGKPEGAVTPFKIVNCDKDFIKTLGMNIVEGRDFIDDQSDSTNFIVNEAALAIINTDDPIGSGLEVWGTKTGKIIGVVRNFHNNHFSKQIDPQIIIVRPQNTWMVFAKIEHAGITEGIQHLAKIQKLYDLNYPFDYSFLSEKFDRQYKMESTTEQVALYFTVVAIFISCLGLFGLASFTAERRTKELGIRKVLGASVSNLVTMLCSDFARIVMIAILVSWPIAYFIANAFLERYTYHFELTWLIFILSGACVLFLALLTVFYQSFRASITNPVKSLRTE